MQTRKNHHIGMKKKKRMIKKKKTAKKNEQFLFKKFYQWVRHQSKFHFRHTKHKIVPV